MVGRAVGAIHDDAHAAQIEMRGKGALAEFYVASRRILHPPRLAELGRSHALEGLRQLALDGAFGRIGKLGPGSGKELDAVVVVGVVRRADHDARGEPQRPREVRHRGRWHGPYEQGVHSGSRQACLESGLEHIAGDPRVLADQHRGVRDPFLLAAREHLARGVAQLHHEIRRDRGLPDLAANAVRAEILAGHGLRVMSHAQPPTEREYYCDLGLTTA
jgi:hypothetical protein